MLISVLLASAVAQTSPEADLIDLQVALSFQGRRFVRAEELARQSLELRIAADGPDSVAAAAALRSNWRGQPSPSSPIWPIAGVAKKQANNSSKDRSVRLLPARERHDNRLCFVKY